MKPPASSSNAYESRRRAATLETRDDTLEMIAKRCGFGTSETLRRVFHRRVGVTPDSYRRRFRVVSSATAGDVA